MENYSPRCPNFKILVQKIPLTKREELNGECQVVLAVTASCSVARGSENRQLIKNPPFYTYTYIFVNKGFIKNIL